MRFNRFPQDKLTLVKPNGSRIENVLGICSSDSIVIGDSLLPLEEGDHLERKLPSGLLEVYLVHDRGFYPKFHNIAAHYQAKVRKLTTMEIERRQKSHVISVHGNNARVNVNSTDNSNNMVISHEDDLFKVLAAEVERHVVDGSERNALLAAIDSMKDAQGKEQLLNGYQRLVAAAANHMTLIAPFLPSLAKLFAS